MKKILNGLLLLAMSFMVLEANDYTKTFTRMSLEEMQNVANKDRLGHRLFYVEPSKGADSAWFDAVKRGDLASIKKMVDSGQNLEAKDTAALGQTALGWAAFIGYYDVVEYLHSKGADLFATDKGDVSSSFKSAVLGGNIKVIEFLYPKMKDKLDLNAQDVGDGENALMIASWNNRIDAAKFLIKAGVNINLSTGDKTTFVTKSNNENALSYACVKNDKEMIDLLIKAGGINSKTKKASCK